MRVGEPAVHVTEPYTRRQWRSDLRVALMFRRRTRRAISRRYASTFEDLAFKDHPLMGMVG